MCSTQLCAVTSSCELALFHPVTVTLTLTAFCTGQLTAQAGLRCVLLLQVRSQFRKIFIEMGFEEMPTNNYVESSFWNFDALFQPQQHPARDAHDTFFVTREPPSVIFHCSTPTC